MENNSNYELSDFFRHIGYAADLKHVYFVTSDAPFPALTYIFFHYLYLINPVQTDLAVWLRKGYTLPYEPIIYVMWTVIQVLLILYFIQRITKLSLHNTVCLTIALFLSLPFFAGAFERGNTVLVTLLLLMAALYLREKEGKLHQELALIFIALASASKITPCIMGMLYIKENRWKDTAHLFFWGIVLVVLPFLFTGGFAGFVQFIRVIAGHGRTQVTRWTSIPGIINYIMLHLFGNTGHIAKAVMQITVQLIFFTVMMLFTFRTKFYWKTVLYLSMIMAYGHSNSYRYYTIYLVLPLLFLIQSETKGILNNNVHSKYSLYMYYALFGAIFTIPIWVINGDPERWMSLAAYVLCCYSIAEDVYLARKTSIILTTRL